MILLLLIILNNSVKNLGIVSGNNLHFEDTSRCLQLRLIDELTKSTSERIIPFLSLPIENKGRKIELT